MMQVMLGAFESHRDFSCWKKKKKKRKEKKRIECDNAYKYGSVSCALRASCASKCKMQNASVVTE